MFDFHEKRKIRRVIYSKIFIVAVFVFALLIGRSVYERFTIEREMAAKLNERIEEREALEQRAALLETKVEHLKNERGIEEELRTRFDVAREGEQVVIIIDDHKLDTRTSEESPIWEENEEKSLLEMLKFW